MKHAIYFLILLFFISCKTQKETQQTVTENVTKVQTDTIRIVERDTTFLYHPAPEVSSSVGIDSSYLETSLAWSMAMLKNGILVHKIGNKQSIPIRAPGINRTENKSKSSETDIKKESKINQTKTVEKFRFLNAFFYYSGILLYILVSIFLTFKLLSIKKGA